MALQLCAFLSGHFWSLVCSLLTETSKSVPKDFPQVSRKSSIPANFKHLALESTQHIGHTNYHEM